MSAELKFILKTEYDDDVKRIVLASKRHTYLNTVDLQDITAAITDKDERLVLAYLDDQVVGYVRITRHEKWTSRLGRWSVCPIFVASDYQTRGIGLKLIQWVKDKYAPLVATTDVSNQPSCKLFLQADFFVGEKFYTPEDEKHYYEWVYPELGPNDQLNPLIGQGLSNEP